MAQFTSVDEYIKSFSGVPKKRLEEMRALIREALPGAKEQISYNIPAYSVDGKLIIYYAGYAGHIGMYPGRTKSEAYNQLAEKYAHGKSTARFLHTEPLPREVIKKFIQIRKEEASKTDKKY